MGVCYVYHKHRINGIHTSGYLWVFSFLLVVCSSVRVYMFILFHGYVDYPHEPKHIFTSLESCLFVLHITLLFITFVLCSLADKLPQKRSSSTKEPEPDESTVKGQDEKTLLNGDLAKDSIEMSQSFENQPSVEVGDKDSKEPLAECPERTASFLSQILYWWFNGMTSLGFKRSLEYKDLWQLNDGERTENVTPIFDRSWLKQVNLSALPQSTAATTGLPESAPEDDIKVEFIDASKCKKKPGIASTLASTFGAMFLGGAILKLFQDLLQFVNPQLLKLFISFISSPDDPVWHGVVIATSFFVVSNIQSIFLNQYFHIMFRIGMRVRTSIISAVYRKSLGLSNAARRDTTSGEIVNLMAVDAQRFVDLLPFLNLIWSAPLQIILTLYFLYQELGASVFAGLTVMVLLMPLNAVLATFQRKLQIQQMKLKDERVKVINEILAGMKVIKLYAWEEPFIAKVSGIRSKELEYLKKISYISAVESFLWTCAPFIVSFVSFALFVLSSDENVLDAKKAFVSLSLFNILRFPLTMLPSMVNSLILVSVAVKRLNKFLNSSQLDKYIRKEKMDGKAIEVQDGTFTWDAVNVHDGKESKNEVKSSNGNAKEQQDEDAEKQLLNPETNGNASNNKTAEEESKKGTDKSFKLDSINFTVPTGSLTAIVGRVGSGKSSLLSALLGEMEYVSGSVKIQETSSIAYVAQQAWIQNAKLRDNILFGQKYVKSQYQSIIEMCALKPDIAILPGGDETEIGEKGINLSGGQKQRVAIARACYSNSDIILFDDPLSAVDSHVAQHIFRKVLSNKKGYLKDKTRVLVTNNIALLPDVDQIIVMADGCIKEVGTYKELMENSGKFADFVREFAEKKHEEAEKSPTLDTIKPLTEPLSEESLSRIRTESELSKESIKLKKSLTNENKLIETEKTETGTVKFAVYIHYFHSLTMFWLFSLLLGFLGMQVASVSSNLWLASWSNDLHSANVTDDDRSWRNKRLGVYGFLGLMQGEFWSNELFLVQSFLVP